MVGAGAVLGGSEGGAVTDSGDGGRQLVCVVRGAGTAGGPGRGSVDNSIDDETAGRSSGLWRSC